MTTIYYLACPYSHLDPDVRLDRFRTATAVAARLLHEDYLIYSPITHSHPIAMLGSLDAGWDFWRVLDLAILDRCDEMLVLTLTGWKESVGVQAEIEHAKRKGMSITYLDGRVTVPGAGNRLDSRKDAAPGFFTDARRQSDANNDGSRITTSYGSPRRAD